MRDTLKKIDEALEQLNTKSNTILQIGRAIKEIEESNLSDEIKVISFASLRMMERKIESLHSEYHLDDEVKNKLASVISLEDIREKFTIDILKKIIVSYTQLKEYDKFIDTYVVTSSNKSEPSYWRKRGRIKRALSVLKLYSNYDEYRNIETHIYSKVPEVPQEILFKLDSDLKMAKIKITDIREIVKSINVGGNRAKKPEHFKSKDKRLFMTGNRIGLFLK